MRFDEDGTKIYDCIYCRDAGWVHPRKDDGKPDYSRTLPCRHCKPEAYPGEVTANE